MCACANADNTSSAAVQIELTCRGIRPNFQIRQLLNLASEQRKDVAVSEDWPFGQSATEIRVAPRQKPLEHVLFVGAVI
jgi:hypothetical protein